jgi:NCS2 family nucleobase:cation symporter-2
MDHSIYSRDGPDTIVPGMTPQTRFGQRMRSVVKALTTREGLIGDYDYAFLFQPAIPYPFKKDPRPAPFFGLNDPMPVFLALLLGLQHALAMLAGIVTPPIILAAGLNLSAELTQYLVSVSLIVCGLLSSVQITRFQVYRTNYYIGSGVLSVVGVSFAIITVGPAAFAQMYENGFCPSADDGTPLPCPDGYGALIATSAVTALVEILVAIPPKTLRKIFPPIVTGPTVMLIGVSLVQSGFDNWIGGSGSCMSRPTSGIYTVCVSPSRGAARATLGQCRIYWIGFCGFFVNRAL